MIREQEASLVARTRVATIFPNLLSNQKLINKGDLTEYLENAVKACPKILLLEDLVAIYGSEWGFDAPTIRDGSCSI